MRRLLQLFCLGILFLMPASFIYGQDAGVSSILSPTTRICGSETQKITVIVKNYGSSTLSNVPVNLSVSGTSTFSTTGSIKSLGSGSSDTLTFSSTMDLSAGGSYIFKAYTTVSGDVQKSNDTSAQAILVYAAAKGFSAKTYTGCYAQKLTIKSPSSTSGAVTLWYADIADKFPFLRSDSLSTTISKNDTFYVESAKPNSLTTTMSTNNWQQGNMFNAFPLKNITLDSVDVNLDNPSSSDSVMIYYRVGGYGGYESTPSAWTLQGTYKVSPQGIDKPTKVKNVGLEMKGGLVYGFYVRSKNGEYMHYLNANSTSDSVYTSDLVIKAGLGVAGSFGQTFSPRLWSGTFYYSECHSAKAPVYIKLPVIGSKLSYTSNTGRGINKGTKADPDGACPGDSLIMTIDAPTGLSNADYGTKWTLNNFSLKSPSGWASTAYTISQASTKDPVKIFIKPGSSDQDSLLFLSFNLYSQAANCDSAVGRYIQVGGSVSAGLSVTDGCHLRQSYFMNNTVTKSINAKYLWDFGDGASSSSPQHTYLNPGTYTVTLYAQSGTCIDSAKRSITINPSPFTARIDIGSPFVGLFKQGTNFAPDEVCAKDTVTYELVPPTGLTNADFGTKWNITSLTFTTTKGTPGTDTALTITNGVKNSRLKFFPANSWADSMMLLTAKVVTANGKCDTTFTRYILVRPTPVADFSWANVCMDKDMVFTNKSSIASGTISTYKWDFGDGSILTSSATQVTHKYKAAGKYNVTLNATTSYGCSNTSQSYWVDVFAMPQAAFQASSTACQGSPITFVDQSKANATSMHNWIWSFGNGDSSMLQNPAYSYNKAGKYVVTLIIINSNGCRDTAKQQLTIEPKPVAAFNYMNACVRKNVNFANQSTSPVPGTPTYKWDFGDGATSGLASPSHAFKATGTYEVQLIIIAPNGCSDTMKQTITPYPLPAISLTATELCEGANTEITDTVTIQPGTIYVWNYGDGSSPVTLTNKSVKHKYPTAGTYTVSVTKTSPSGCSDTSSMVIKIGAVPVAKMTATPGCAGTAVAFTNQSTVGAGNMTYDWDFGDGARSTDGSPSHTFTKEGIYKVKLTATADGGCASTTGMDLAIYAVPVANKWQATVNKDRKATFTNGNQGNNTYLWEFGDGDTSTAENPVHTYAADGSYAVKFTVTNENGCIASRTDSLKVGNSSIDEDKAGKELVKVYPNPFSNSATVQYSLQKHEMVYVRVFDMSGKQLCVLKEGNMPAGTHTLNFDANKYGLPAGVYFLNIMIGDKPYTISVIKTE